MQLLWNDFKAVVNARTVSPQYILVGPNYWIKLIDGAFQIECMIPADASAPDTVDFLANYQSLCNKAMTQSVAVQSQPSVVISTQPAPAPFASKIIGTKKLFKRVHGIQATLTASSNTDVIFVIPYAWAKITGLEVIGGETLDHINLFILDTSSGTYSTYPNAPLNQFGFNVNSAKDYYNHSSEYDADLYQNMQIKVSYTSISAKTVGINFILNEVK